MRTLLLEGPFESDYSLAVVNRRLAKALVQSDIAVQFHQRDNVTDYFPSEPFLREYPDLAPRMLRRRPETAYDIHSRYIYPPHIDGYAGKLRVIHCYGWEETSFPVQYVQDFNRGVDLVTVMSGFVKDVLRANGVKIPIEVVGLGADHILDPPPKQLPGVETSGFTFVHVSSCFPRKAADVLVKAFCTAFTRHDDVRLIIKTFDNPHNTIREIVDDATRQWPAHPPIDIIWQSLRSAEMRWLYESSDCLVSASRGEGFGLPVAEAMLLGLPVVASVYSGQADICVEGGCWPVEYELTQARSHLTEGDSLWAEPIVESLRSQMRAVRNASEDERRRRTAVAAEHVSARFTWARTASRHWQVCCDALDQKIASSVRPVRMGGQAPPCKIGFVTSWNTRCGIAEYSRYIVQSLPSYCRPVIFASRTQTVREDQPNVVRCWDADAVDGGGLGELEAAILKSDVQAVSIQFNFGFFSADRLHRLVQILHHRGIIAAVTMHATSHPDLVRLRPALQRADLCICHRPGEVDRLRALDVARKVVLLRQGIPHLAQSRDAAHPSPRRPAGSFVVACFGFFLPPKGIEQLIHAFALAKHVYPLLQLRLLNAIYPIPESRDYARRCLALVREKRLADSVTFRTEFLEDDEILSELASADLVVLPYLYSSESSSAAVRLPLASQTPVLCSDLAIFDEFDDCLHRFPAGDGIALANALIRLSRHPEDLRRFTDRQRQVTAALAWPEIATELAELILNAPDLPSHTSSEHPRLEPPTPPSPGSPGRLTR